MSGRGENAMEMESVAIASLSNSFRQVPLSAVPAIVDCILASTGLSPSTLFSSLFESFHILAKDSIKHLKLYPHDGNYIMGVVGALCHLLKKLGTNSDGIQLFIWQCFMPLMEVVYELNHEMLNKIVESFFDVVATTNSWSVLEATMVPYFLRSVGLSIGMHRNEETDVFEWSQYSVFLGLNDLKTDDMEKELRLSPSASFRLPVSLHILAQILDSSLQSFQTALGSGSCANYRSCPEELSAELLWDLCSMSQRLLLESMEHRSCTIGILLPVIFEAFAHRCSFQISVHGKPFVLSRLLKNAW